MQTPALTGVKHNSVALPTAGTYSLLSKNVFDFMRRPALLVKYGMSPLAVLQADLSCKPRRPSSRS
jgi:hypothetical protein